MYNCHFVDIWQKHYKTLLKNIAYLCANQINSNFYSMQKNKKLNLYQTREIKNQLVGIVVSLGSKNGKNHAVFGFWRGKHNFTFHFPLGNFEHATWTSFPFFSGSFLNSLEHGSPFAHKELVHSERRERRSRRGGGSLLRVVRRRHGYGLCNS